MARRGTFRPEACVSPRKQVTEAQHKVVALRGCPPPFVPPLRSDTWRDPAETTQRHTVTNGKRWTTKPEVEKIVNVESDPSLLVREGKVESDSLRVPKDFYTRGPSE